VSDRYFDHAATTPVAPEVLDAMLPWLREDFGNAHSLHHWGRKAEAAVEEARAQVAELVGADDPAEIVFTSGATEANNLVLLNFSNLAISPFEHSAVREPALEAGAEIIANDGWDLTSPPSSAFVSVMAVNNETGAVLSVPGTRHVDAVQAVGKIPWSVDDVDFASMSAHKIYGPKGVGALYIRGAMPLQPLIVGGDQERGQRSGTLNVPGIVGFGAAAQIARERQSEDFAHAAELRQIVLDELESLSDWRTNDAPYQSPHILSLSFREVEGETLVIETDAAGFGISAGAACSSRSTEPSHVLTALGLTDEWRRGTIRISFGRSNTATSALALVSFLRQTVTRLRSNL
jgi:cysteine desulfurase